METTNTGNSSVTSSIINGVSGLISVIGGLFTSKNELKAQRLEIEKLNLAAETNQDIALQQQLLAALNLKKEAYASKAADVAAQSKTKGIYAIMIGLFVGVAGYLFLKSNPDTLKLKK